MIVTFDGCSDGSAAEAEAAVRDFLAARARFFALCLLLSFS